VNRCSVALALLLVVRAGAAFAEARVVAAVAPARLKDPCGKTTRKGEWVKLPDGGPPAAPRAGPAAGAFDGRRFVVSVAGKTAAYDVCAAAWSGVGVGVGAAAAGRVGGGGEGIDLLGARLIPGYNPRESSYDGFATARLVLPSGKEISAPRAGAPAPRMMYVVAFDGRRLLVWGGFGPAAGGGAAPSTLGDGAVWDVRSNRWRPMSSSGAPSARFQPVAAWTGSRLLIWGGGAGVPGGEPTRFADGAAYDPVRDVWKPMAAEGAPPPRWKPIVVWTGGALVVAGGGDSLTIGGARGRDDAYVYDPKADRWSAVAGAPKLAEAHWVHAFVDAQGRVLFFDTHVLRSFGVLDPRALRFDEVALPETLRERSGMGVAWTGARLLVWGGYRQVPGYVNPCDNFRGPGGCDPPSPPFAIFSDGWLYAPP
jgi:hypothetical protein